MSLRTVLCALDNRDLARIFEKALEGQGYRVMLAGDGLQAQKLWIEARPDLVILDISLSKQDGFEVIGNTRNADTSQSSVCPVILLCDSRISPHYQERADSLGVELLIAKPVALDDLVLRASQLVKSGAPTTRALVSTAADKEANAAAAPLGQKTMAGTFAELPFPRLLHQLHGLRASGVLMVANGRKRKAIELREGVPIAIKSNLIHECLGKMLIRGGMLTEEEQSESFERSQRGEGLQGEILIAMELVDEATIARALCDQAREKLFEIFEWEKGKFKFELRGKIKRANALALNASPANVILKGVRGRYPLAAIDSYLAARRDRHLSQAASPFYRFQEIDFNADEAQLLSQVDGTHCVENYVGDSESVRRALFGLLATGMLKLHRSEGAEPRKTSTRNAPAAHKASQENERKRDETMLRAELTELVQSLQDKNHFEMFGIAQTCSDTVLDEAHATLARRVHPDRFQTASHGVREIAAEVYTRVMDTYDVLHDKRTRQQYLLELQMGERRALEGEASRRALAAETSFQKGIALIAKRGYEEALLQFGLALEKNSDDGEYHAYYGWCLYLCHQDSPSMVEEAIEHVRRGAQLATDREKPLLFLGRLYKVMGKVTAAERMFTRAVQLHPECVEALRELRLINLRREKSKGLIRRLLRR